MDRPQPYLFGGIICSLGQVGNLEETTLLS